MVNPGKKRRDLPKMADKSHVLSILYMPIHGKNKTTSVTLAAECILPPNPEVAEDHGTKEEH